MVGGVSVHTGGTLLAPYMTFLSGIDEKNVDDVPPVTDAAVETTVLRIRCRTTALRSNGPCVDPRLRPGLSIIIGGSQQS